MKKLIKLDDVFILLGNNLAKHGEYALTCTNEIKQYDQNKLVLWNYGCAKVIASSGEHPDSVLHLDITQKNIDYDGEHLSLISLNELYDKCNEKTIAENRTFTPGELQKYLVDFIKFCREGKSPSDLLNAQKYIALPKYITEWDIEVLDYIIYIKSL